MKLIMENWRGYEQQLLLEAKVNYYFSLFEESNEELLKEMLLDEGATLEFFKNILKIPKKAFDALYNKVWTYLMKKLKEKDVSKPTLYKISSTFKNEKNRKLAFNTMMALVGVLLGAQFGPQILQLIDSLGNDNVSDIARKISKVGDVKDYIQLAGALPAFGISTLLKKGDPTKMGFGAPSFTPIAEA